MSTDAEIKVRVTGNAPKELDNIAKAAGKAETAAEQMGGALKGDDAAMKAVIAKAIQLGVAIKGADGRLREANGRLLALRNVAALVAAAEQKAANEAAHLAAQVAKAGNAAKGTTTFYQRVALAAKAAGTSMESAARSAVTATVAMNKGLGDLNTRLSNSVGNLPFLRGFTDVTSMIEGSVGGAFRAVAGVATVAAVGFGAGVALAVREASELETAMSRVRAATAGSREEMATLTREASRLGAETQYSAAEVASVQENYAKAGFNVQQIVDATGGTLSFAAATGTDTGFASGLLAQTIRSMGFDAGQAGSVADSLVIGSQASNVDVTDLGEAMKYAAPVFASMGRSQRGVAMNDMVALAGILGDQGIRGSMAGTALRSGYSRLASPTSNARSTLSTLRVSTTDDAGNMRRLPDILADLRNALAGKSTGQQSAALTSIFGVNAASAFGSILNADPARFGQLVGALENSGGAADRTARIMQDNLTGDLEKLGGAIGGAATSIGTEMLPAVRNSTTSIAGFVGALGDAMTSSGVATTVFGGLGHGIEGFTNRVIDAFEMMLPAIAAVAETMGILDPGQAAQLTGDFSRRMTEARKSQVRDRAQRETDQLDNETVARLNMLHGIAGQVTATQGSTGAELGQNLRAGLARMGVNDLSAVPGLAEAIAQLQGTRGARGGEALTPQQRRDALARLNATIAPTIAGLEGSTLANQSSEHTRIQATSSAQERVVELDRIGRPDALQNQAGRLASGEDPAAALASIALAPVSEIITILKLIGRNTASTGGPPTGSSGAGTGN